MEWHTKLTLGSAAGLLFAAALIVPAGTVVAHPEDDFETPPADFLTGGGWIMRDTGFKGNFGIQGGVKHGDWWGGVNYIDHTDGLHVQGREVTDYEFVGPTTRIICGDGTSNHFGDISWRVWAEDNGEPGRDDVFWIRVGRDGVVLYTTEFDADNTLGGPGPGGGNIQLHKGNKSNVPPDDGGFCRI